MVTLPTRTVATRQELETALARLSTEELTKLQVLASVRATGLAHMDWADLLQEAIVRALSGSRAWPRDVPLLAFLAQTMRSVANESWLGMQRADAAFVEIESADAQPLDPEREAAAAEALQRLNALFVGDPDTLAVLEGMALGSAPAEIQRQYAITPQRYAAAQKRIRRRLAGKNTGDTL
jgi:DNA-directed RNA polymerase specialized sigma24 family protein